MAFGGVLGGVPGLVPRGASGVVPGGAPGGALGGVPGGALGGAASGAPVDPEQKEAYYLRLHLLIVKEGTAILKTRFDHSVPPPQLHAKLQQCTKTFNHAKKNSLLSKTQLSNLFPQYRPPSSDTFDISLLVYLLRNICGLKSKWWSEDDNSKIPDKVVEEVADIARLRNLRNQMQHKQVASLEQVEFETMWDLVEKVMLRLATKCNIPDQKQKIDDIKDRQLDLVTEEMRSIRANTELFFQDYQDDDRYVETAAYQKAKAVLEEKQIAILTGHPGEGKTTMAARLALHMSQPRNCLKLVTPSDWRKIDLSLKLFDTVIIDDIFGAGALDQKLVGDWRQYLTDIERAAKKKAVRVIITSRHYIFEESKEELGSLPMFKDENETVLLLTSSELTHDEKTNILKMQAEKNEKQLEDYTIFKCVEASKGPTEDINDFLFGFPECASMFVRNENMLRKGAAFFKKPASHYKKYLEDLYKGKEKDKFLALVAVWAKENKRLSRDELRTRKTASDHIKLIAEIFDHDLDKEFLETMRLSLDTHVGGYLVFSEATGEYAFSHNVIGDMVGLVIGKKKPEETVEICPRDFLMEYISIGEAARDDFKVSLKERQFHYLIEKCSNMLLRKHCNTVAETPTADEFQTLQRTGQRNNDIKIINTIDFGIIKHKAFSSEKFVKEFIDYVVEEDLVNEVFSAPVMRMKGYFLDYGIWKKQLDMCLMGYAWYSGAIVFAKEVITREIVGEENVDHSIPLLLAAHSKQKESVEFLLSHGAKVTGDAIYIAMHKSIELLNMFLQHPGTDVNDRGNAINGNFPLIVAARKGLTEAVKCMLTSGADTGVQNTAKMTALHKAILYKHEDVIEMLVEAGAPLNIKGGKFKRTPLHLAVDLENMELVKLLLRKHASLTVKDHRGHYPIHIAAVRGNIEILRELYVADRTQDKLRISSYGTKSVIKGMSLFHVAVWKKNEKLLNALIDLTADPNVQDFYGQTPLFFAIMKKQEYCIRKLLEYEVTNKRKPQKQGFTPLHAAIHKNLDEIAKQLARYSDVNARDKYGKTPLHAACEKAKLELIRTLLVKYGADPRIITKRGDTVYHILRRSKKKLSENEVDNSQQAEQLISEFDPEFAKQLPNLTNKGGVVIKVRTTR
ncbi:uncharacterized protein LOC128547261 [Mercenaria mercenaria]|uniref:uncharacterized protein LOC128547261 n=1 Tax=Mercenaria mercenaria TaxID=6596 RepID=UPI00234F7964|nr:uncharacterized protein LOC128547261 [Mercenaria mercenaria]